MGAPCTSRIPRKFTKLITFDGTSVGDVGTDTIATVTGSVLIESLTVRCKTDLTGSGVLELGVAGNTASLIAQTTATDIDATEFWHNATPKVGVAPAILKQAVCKDVILTTSGATVTAGVLEFVFRYLPESDDGKMG